MAPRLAAMTFVIANGHEGTAFFDNFLPCLNRGAVHYVNSDVGRRVWFEGCDLGTGVTIAGHGEIEWAAATPRPDRAPLCTFGPSAQCAAGFRWHGTLAITLDDTLTVALDSWQARDIVVAVAGDSIQLQSLNVVIGLETTPMNDPGLAAELFDATGRTLDAIPNPSETVTALTDADLHRLAYQGITDLALILFDETLESARGDHVHTTSCGTTGVTYDAQKRPTLTASWTACPSNGLIYDGNFTVTWGQFQVMSNTFDEIRMDVAGTLTVGGAVPRVRISQLRLLMSNADGGDVTGSFGIRLTLSGTGGSRSLAETIPVDD